MFERISNERLLEMEGISRRSGELGASHRHWFPNVYAQQLLTEVRLLRAELNNSSQRKDSPTTKKGV